MKCPIDNETLVMADRSGVEIDYCPKCRGVWLDRGELDKIIERAAVDDGRPASYSNAPSRQQVDRRQDTYAEKKRYKKKRENFLGELFDF